MYNVSMRMLGSKEDAEDIVQNSFVEAFRNLRNFRFESTFGSWLKRIVINKCINHLKLKKINVVPFDSQEYHISEESYEESKNLALTELGCNRNQLMSLDLSKNMALSFLQCDNNKLTNLDVSQNSILEGLICYENKLTSLNAKNGNNYNFIVLDARYNPDLNCIQVDDVIYSYHNQSFAKDICANFSEDCALASLCISDLSGTHSYISTNLQAETGTCPLDPVTGTVTWTKICNNSYSVSDLYFGMSDSSCCDDIPLPSSNEGFVLSSGDCNLLISGFLDIYGYNVTWTITGVSGSELYISWKNNLEDYGYLPDSGDVVITREGGADWPPLFTQ